MILSDKDIKKLNCIKSVYPVHIGPSSVDFHLDNKFVFSTNQYFGEEVTKFVNDKSELKEMQAIVLQPGDFILGQTEEIITLPSDITATCEGRSSVGRLGITIHITAGYIDPGFKGNITLEIANLNRIPITLNAGMRIGQFSFMKMTSKADNPYNGNYQSQQVPTISKLPYV